MAEAVRRFRETSGSDVVRRLIARPIRLDPPRLVVPKASPLIEADPSAESADAAWATMGSEIAEIDDTADLDVPFEDDAEDVSVVERLQAEMALMKAILMAERAEAASLRARIELHQEPEPIGAEARATRDRWAGVVDRLLLSQR